MVPFVLALEGKGAPASAQCLYQMLKETRACGGTVEVDWPHPEGPLYYTFRLTLRRPVHSMTGEVLALAGEDLTVTLNYQIHEGVPFEEGP